MNNDKEILHKKLLYRSQNRGCKETDILLGKYALSEIEKFDDNNLAIYENLLQEDDVKIYDWLLGKSAVPHHYKNLISHIRQFHKI